MGNRHWDPTSAPGREHLDLICGSEQSPVLLGDFHTTALLADLPRAGPSTHEPASYVFQVGGDLESINNKQEKKNYDPKIETRNVCSQNGAAPEACGAPLWENMAAIGVFASATPYSRTWEKQFRQLEQTYEVIAGPHPTRP